MWNSTVHENNHEYKIADTWRNTSSRRHGFFESKRVLNGILLHKRCNLSKFSKIRMNVFWNIEYSLNHIL